jgi:hypothetical protein
VDEVDTFFAWYSERYVALDVDAVCGVYETPLLAVRDGIALYLADRQAVRAHLAAVMADYAMSGAVRADIASLDAKPLGPSAAIATVHWFLGDGRGTLMEDFHTTYQLLRAGDAWRILSYTNHD